MQASDGDADWHDRMYNNRALVPESAAHLAAWAQASQEARARATCALDCAYGDLPSETLDIYSGVADKPWRCAGAEAGAGVDPWWLLARAGQV